MPMYPAQIGEHETTVANHGLTLEPGVVYATNDIGDGRQFSYLEHLNNDSLI